MRFSQASFLAACVPAAVSARFIEPLESDNIVVLKPQPPSKFKIETAPGEYMFVNETEKWALKQLGQNFMDVTQFPSIGLPSVRNVPYVHFPSKCAYKKRVKRLAKHLGTSPMKARLQHLTSYHTRYYKSETGLQASSWILSNLTEMVQQAGANATVSVKSFPHEWEQHSVIATIPGRTNSTIVIGAHLDSINMFLPSILAAPGADDNGSGTVTIMEVFRALLQSRRVVKGKAQNTIEFHWYSAEEGGLLGSQEIFQSYMRKGRDVKAMLQQDMTGYVQGTLDAGKPESVGVVNDYVHPGLTSFIKTVINEYCDIPWVETKCGYACSDHASAAKFGYPSAFVIESAFEDSNRRIHTQYDVIEHLSFDHMLQHALMTLGLVYELGFHEFNDVDDKDMFGEL